MRRVLVDSAAALLFFTIAAGATELVMAGMTLEQVLVSRTVSVPVILATGRPYGMWRDLVLERLAPGGRGARAAVDVTAFVTFQVPVYAVILWLAGADGGQMAAALASATAGMVLLSRPYGLWLDRFRQLFGTMPGAEGASWGITPPGGRQLDWIEQPTSNRRVCGHERDREAKDRACSHPPGTVPAP